MSGTQGILFCNLEKASQRHKKWREHWLSFLQEASLIIVPSKDMEQRIKNIFHFHLFKWGKTLNWFQLNHRIFRWALLADSLRLREQKLLKSNIHGITEEKFHTLYFVWNFIWCSSHRRWKRYISILGPYKEQEVYSMISSHQINYFWFPGVLPETYSYTLSIPIRLRIPCLSSDIGAIAFRIQSHRWGETYPWNAQANKILDKLLDFNYRKFYNPDFVIENTSFGSFETFYAGIPFKKVDGISWDIPSFPSPFKELPAVLYKGNLMSSGKEPALLRKERSWHMWIRTGWKQCGKRKVLLISWRKLRIKHWSKGIYGWLYFSPD